MRDVRVPAALLVLPVVVAGTVVGGGATAGAATVSKPVHAALSLTSSRFDTSGLHARIAATRTTLPAGDSVISWTLTFGDHTATKGRGRLPRYWDHVYARAGTATATLVITDKHHKHSTAKLAIIYPGSNYALPSVTLTQPIAPEPEPGQPVSFTMATTGWTGRPGTTSLDFGDGTSTTAALSDTTTSTWHTYAAAGTYHAVASVHDAAGSTRTERLDVSVAPAQSLYVTSLSSPEVGGTAAAVTVDLPYDPGTHQLQPASSITLSPGAGMQVQGMTSTAGAGTWSLAFTTPGQHTVTASYTDSYRQVHTGAHTFQVLPAATGSLVLAGCQTDPTYGPDDDCQFTHTQAVNNHLVTQWSVTLVNGSYNAYASNTYTTGLDNTPFGPLVPGAWTATLQLQLDNTRWITCPSITFTAP